MIKKFSLLCLTCSLLLLSAKAIPNAAEDPRVKQIYEGTQNQLVWVQNGSLTPCAKTLVEALSHAGDEGLWEEDYKPIIDDVAKANLTSTEGQREADQALTLGALNYISDMYGERLNPKLADRTIYIKPVSVSEVELLKEYLSKSNNCSWVQDLALPTKDYQSLKKTLANYRTIQRQGGWPQLPEGTKLEKGDQAPSVLTLRNQLRIQGILQGTPQENDMFDEELEQALIKYQEMHGLENDGKVGEGTLKALNTPVDERIKQIIVSMEKQRWFQRPMPSRYIQVNIPGFILKAVDQNQPQFLMKIITGKQYTKTPVFNADLKEIIFNPSWHVPASILHEVAPKMASSPGEMAQKGYHWVGDTIVQSPGPANSLGKIKFQIESPFSIYLHGTPNQSLFDKANRGLSHGCIRVEDPKKLARFVFNDPKTWDIDRIAEEASGSTTKSIKLDQPLAVFITYFTVFEDLDQNMHFVPDEYGQDKHIWAALEKARRY